MYVGIDVGGTKTLVAALNDEGVIMQQAKFPTPPAYDDFLEQLQAVRQQLRDQSSADDFWAGGIGIPAVLINRQHGIGVNFGNLPWRHVPVAADMEHLWACPFVLENDAKMAALSEAMLLRRQYARVLYVTVSTGIGFALVVDGTIDTNFGDGGGRTLLLEHRGQAVPWEDFASGRAIVERYHHKAKDIEDAATWRSITRDLAKGLIELIATTEPEVIVIGGSVGVYFDRYGTVLAAELKKYHLPLISLPTLREAQRPEEAVVYGCYDLAKQVYGHAAAHH